MVLLDDYRDTAGKIFSFPGKVINAKFGVVGGVAKTAKDAVV